MPKLPNILEVNIRKIPEPGIYNCVISMLFLTLNSHYERVRGWCVWVCICVFPLMFSLITLM